MSFDPRSLERLRELGRSLPQPLPKPEPPASSRARAAEPRHKVERETNPEQLFRELMQASTDGTVPPHLMERLRQLEADRQEQRLANPLPADPAPSGPSARGGPRRRDAPIGKPDPKLASAHGDLYTTFQQLLLEDDEAD